MRSVSVARCHGCPTPSLETGWFTPELLDEMLELWDAGQVVVGKDLLYAVRWGDDRDSTAIARDVFNTDLDQERVSRA